MSATDPVSSLPSLREVIKASGLSSKKSLGQNFILDLNVTRRIARAAGPLKGIAVLEVGPGPGGLTRGLLLEGAASVIAVELDRRFEPALQSLSAASDGRVHLIFEDALSLNYEALAAETGIRRVVANLPYNVATPLLVRWLTGEDWPPWFDRLTVMVQEEVAERIVAAPGTPHYGRLAVLTQHRAKPRVLLTLPPSVFTPSPKVSSAVIEIVPCPPIADAVPVRVLEEVTAAAFGQRRKMLRSSLAALSVNPGLLLEAAGLDPTLRAERLSVQDFIALARCLIDFRSRHRA